MRPLSYLELVSYFSFSSGWLPVLSGSMFIFIVIPEVSEKILVFRYSLGDRSFMVSLFSEGLAS